MLARFIDTSLPTDQGGKMIPFSHVLYINASAEVRHNRLLVGIQLSKSWSSQQISDIP
jgi:hypothetical protein